MRVLIVDTYYPAFLRSVYAADPGLARQPYAEQLAMLLFRGFGTADFYSNNLRALGHVAGDLIVNCEPLQRRWLREHGRPGAGETEAFDGNALIVEQVRAFGPDILHVQDCLNIPPQVVKAAKRHAGFVTTQVACPLPLGLDLSPYDLVLSSMPHFVDGFRRLGLRSEYQRLAFEASLVQRVVSRPRHGAVFVGGISAAHRERTLLLEQLAAANLLEWWGYGVDHLSPVSPLHACYRGEAWGLDMYRVLAGAAVAVNVHIDVAGPFANNMRMYEATGMGTLLLTDWKTNLSELFQPEIEVVTFRDAAECAEMIQHFTGASAEARRIAEAGQQRTLSQHTYAERMAEFVRIIGTHWRR
jgi:spore maturation protein CgeB